MAHALQYKQKYCKMLIEHMSKGYSYSTICAELEVSRETIYLWEKKYPEWATAKQIGYERGLKLFETLLMTKASGKKLKNSDYGVDLNAVTFILKTRFHKDYSEKFNHEHSISPDSNKIQIEFVKPAK